MQNWKYHEAEPWASASLEVKLNRPIKVPFDQAPSKVIMTIPAKEILDREYLMIRSRILDIAAALDRQDRADGDVATDDRRKLLEAGIAILGSDAPDRAAQVQLLFSREYDPDWRVKENVEGANRDAED